MWHIITSWNISGKAWVVIVKDKVKDLNLDIETLTVHPVCPKLLSLFPAD